MKLGIATERSSSTSGIFRLPQLAHGAGGRRDDCAHYGDCIGRFAKVRSNRDGHCPDGCASYEIDPNLRTALEHESYRRIGGEW